MDLKSANIIGRVAAYRPILITGIFGAGGAALAALSTSMHDQIAFGGSIDFLIVLASLTLLPVLIGAIAPRQALHRFAYAAVIAMMGFGASILSERNTLVTFLSGVESNLLIVSIIALALVVIFFAPFWGWFAARSIVAVAALLLGAAASLATVSSSLPFDRQTMLMIVTAISMAASISVVISAAFSRSFVGGAGKLRASAEAVHATSAIAFFAIFLMATYAAYWAVVDGKPVISFLWISLTAVTFCVIPTLMIGGGSLSLRNFTEQLAVDENHRRRRFAEGTTFLRDILPPSSALACSAILLIFMLVSLFDAPQKISIFELGIIGLSVMVAGVAFVSLRTAFLLLLLLAISSSLQVWTYAAWGAPLPDAHLRATALLASTLPQAILCCAWRDARHPREKAREVTSHALVDSGACALLAAIFSLAVFIAASVSGFVPEAAVVARYYIALVLTGFLAAPPLMTATGALFGRI